MAKKNGYILVDRDLEDWRYADSLSMTGFWLRLLLLANWKDTDKVQRGEILISTPTLAHMLNISEKTVNRYLKKLADSGEIEMSTNHHRTRIRIPKYDMYQSGQIYRTEVRTGVQSEVPTEVRTGVQSLPYKKTRNQEIHENKKEKSLKETESFTPPTADQVREYAEKDGLSLDIDSFLDYYQNKDWIVSGEKCRDWRYLVRSWVRKDQEFSKGKKTKKKENLPDWYSADPKRESGSGEKLSADELKAAQEKLKRMGKAKGEQ